MQLLYQTDFFLKRSLRSRFHTSHGSGNQMRDEKVNNRSHDLMTIDSRLTSVSAFKVVFPSCLGFQSIGIVGYRVTSRDEDLALLSIHEALHQCQRRVDSCRIAWWIKWKCIGSRVGGNPRIDWDLYWDACSWWSLMGFSWEPHKMDSLKRAS